VIHVGHYYLRRDWRVVKAVGQLSGWGNENIFVLADDGFVYYRDTGETWLCGPNDLVEDLGPDWKENQTA